MVSLTFRHVLGTAIALALTASPALADSILVLNGTGVNNISSSLTAAGFTVYSAAFNPGSIETSLSAHSDISQIWVWNDGSFGGSFSPADPARAFSAGDMSALATFSAAHGGWVMDGLSWRGNGNVDEQNFTKNEGLALAAFGGGIVLGADDASGAAIVQHVNQVAAAFGFDLFNGVYNTAPASQHFGGSLITTPNAVNPSGVVGTTTYSEVAHGLQGNGVYLSTVVFGQGFENHCCGGTFGPLESATFDGITYQNVNHLVTTNIPGGGIDANPNPNAVPEPASWALMIAGFGLVGGAMRRRTARIRFA
jgi:hypothetical protein